MIQLRNKKSGKIATLVVDGALKYVQAFAVEDDSMERLGEYKTLAELNAEWEDAPEEVEDEIYWFIDAYGNIVQNKITKHYGDRYTDMSYDYERQKQIGNHFESEEEAIKARDKLFAWKRIEENLVSLHWQDEKDGKFSVWGQFYGNMLTNDAILNIHRKDLDLLFPGGEND